MYLARSESNQLPNQSFKVTAHRVARSKRHFIPINGGQSH